MNYNFFFLNLLLHTHDIFFVRIFDLSLPVIILKPRTFKSSVLFGRHTLSDKSLTVLQHPTHLYNLKANGLE